MRHHSTAQPNAPTHHPPNIRYPPLIHPTPTPLTSPSAPITNIVYPMHLPSTDPTPSQCDPGQTRRPRFIHLSRVAGGWPSLVSTQAVCLSWCVERSHISSFMRTRAFTPQRIEQQPSLPSMPSNFTSISWSLACVFGNYIAITGFRVG